MAGTNRMHSPDEFSAVLFERMKKVNTGIKDLELYEFRYALENLFPEDGWDSVELDKEEDIEKRIGSRDFYTHIELRPRSGESICLNKTIIQLTQMLFVGLVRNKYYPGWVNLHFYFDIRGFFFLPRTVYFTEEVLNHFGNKPYMQFNRKQKRLERFQGVGYRDFKEANSEIDQAFVALVKELIDRRGTPILITLAGPTAAGKTEITERLYKIINQAGKKITTIEVDNFLLDREYRDDKPMGKESTHFDMFINCLAEILKGKKVYIPRYDFVNATSSHDLDGNLKVGCTPLEIEPADIIFMEGNFPFHIQELSNLIGINAVYLTDDPIRLKRKWKRDIDYRKKYDPSYFRNRYFRTQFLRAQDIYLPLMQVCDIVVDTTGAALWVTPQTMKHLNQE
jgi:uridine kinase